MTGKGLDRSDGPWSGEVRADETQERMIVVWSQASDPYGDNDWGFPFALQAGS